MLIFFGTRSSKIDSKQLHDNTECPYCKSQNSLVVTTFSRYFHIFWIPFLPLSKTRILECNHCKKSYNEYNIPLDIKYKLNNENKLKPPKTPLRHGCGCLVIIAIIIVNIIIGIIGSIFNK